MINLGYQKEDKRILDYDLWRLPGTKYDIRGPKRETLPEKYFVALGAAQTFGRFVKIPYPAEIEKRSGIPGINLGMSGAGPSYFLRDPELLKIINGAEFVIVQVMSGRSTENSVFEVGVNQGTLRKRGSDTPFIFAEYGYNSLIAEADPELLIRVRAETRIRYIAEMSALLRKIKPPKTLLWFSVRKPNYKEGTKNIGDYWGSFPHFVNQDVIDSIKCYADHYVEATTNRGLPQPLFDSETGEPVLMWGEDKFPYVKMRNHNLYYPSPEMHQDVASSLLVLKDKLATYSKRKNKVLRPRSIIVHFHIFKNAGSTIDASLKKYFGERWHNWDPPLPDEVLLSDAVASHLKQNPELDALSSHQMRIPLPNGASFELFPIILLRHPIDRVASIYNFERLPGRRSTSKALHTVKANELSFREYIEWALSNSKAAHPISNYQTLMLSRAQSLRTKGSWDFTVTSQELNEAIVFLNSLPVVGVVEEFEKSAIEFERWLQPIFPGISFKEQKKVNQSRDHENSLTERLLEIKQSLGLPLYEKLIQVNEYDLVLHKIALDKLSKHRVNC